jgi:caa(3)-type oxidase subunit IV
MSEPEHQHPNYAKIWAVLVVLLFVSVLGPMLGIRAVTLMTAFGVALVKAYLVAKHFMHINIEQRYIRYLVGTALVFMFLFFTGAAPDVMKAEGQNWEKPSWMDERVSAPSEHEGSHR